MTKPTYTVEQVEEIATADDERAIENIADIIEDEDERYNMFDRGRLYQILTNTITRLTKGKHE